MNPEAKTPWLADLESGEYVQGRKLLHNITDNTYCCLGVLCERAIKAGVVVEVAELTLPDGRVAKTYDGEFAVLPISVQDWAGVGGAGYFQDGIDDDAVSRWLADVNDISDSFDDVIELIKEHF